MSEVTSIIAIGISFLGVVISFYFAFKKADKERVEEKELNVKNITTIKDDLTHMREDIGEIKTKVEKIDERTHEDHAKIVEHETKIKNLEKEVFGRGKKND